MEKLILQFIVTLLPIFLITGCKGPSRESDLLNSFSIYYDAVKNNDDSQWNFTSDTVKVWFGSNNQEPSHRYKAKKRSKWGEWDEVMNSRAHYDSIWYSNELNAIQGYFYENNDFYELIGASPYKTLRTYSLNDSDKITDLLYEGIEEENTISDKHLDPIYEWALKNDSLEIIELYPNKEFIPSTENALRWKSLLKKYREDKKPN